MNREEKKGRLQVFIKEAGAFVEYLNQNLVVLIKFPCSGEEEIEANMQYAIEKAVLTDLWKSILKTCSGPLSCLSLFISFANMMKM